MVIKLIIAGSRTITKLSVEGLIEFIYLHDIVNNDTWKDLEIVSGCAAGIDTTAIDLAVFHEMKLSKFPADWDNKGRGAGHIRNAEMGKYADALLLIWDGQSKGSASMKAIMEKLNKPVYEVIIKCQTI